MSNHQLSGDSSSSSSSSTRGSALSSPIHTLKRKGKSYKQSFEELFSALTDLKDSHHHSQEQNSTPTTAKMSSPSQSHIMSQQKSLAKFYFLAQQIEYVPHGRNSHIVVSAPAEQDPLIPVEIFSSFLKVQWDTYWTVPLIPTTTCLDVLKYISQKTNREVYNLKMADSEGIIMEHDSLLITMRCKKFVVFEDLEFQDTNNNNNSNNNNKIDNNNRSTCSSTSSSLPSSPNLLNNSHHHDSHSPNTVRKQPPAPPPRSPSTYQGTNPLLIHTDLISEPSTPTLSSSSPSSSSYSTPNSFCNSSVLSSSINNTSSKTGPPLSLANGGSGGSNTASFLSNLISSGGGGGSNCGSTNNSPPVSPPSSRKNSGNAQAGQASSRPSSPNTQKDGASSSTTGASPYIYCKFLDKVEPCDTPPCTEKGIILDNYFSYYYKELLKYTQQRSLRYQRVLEFIEEGKLDENGARVWMQKHYDGETTYLRNKRAGMKLKDFKILTQIGKGGFGQVFLAVKKDSGDTVTLKRIKKQAYEWANQRTQVSHEKTVMMSEAGGKWITKLLYAFQDNHHLYLAMEYHCGGDFRALLNNLGMLSEDDARFYMVEMVEALNSLHSLGYIHRDIKPSNFVIDKHGHIKLIDFGLSKEGYESRNGLHRQSMTDLRKSCIEGKSSWRNTFTNRSNNGMIAYRRPMAHSAVGSPEYMAPEIVQDSGYDLSCDYWSLGCVFMEMLCGFNPFCADTPNDVFINIMQWDEILDWPLFTQDLSAEAADILKRMLCLPNQRFKSLEEFKSHPFFNMNGMTWDSILNHQVPPFVPKVENEMDASYFEDALNNDPTSWELNEDNEKSRDPFSNLNIPFFTYRKSSAFTAFMNNEKYSFE